MNAVPVRRTGTPSAAAEILVHRHGQKRPPEPEQPGKDGNRAAPNPGKIGLRDRENIAKQIAHEVEARAAHEARRDQPRRQRGMSQDAKQRVVRDLPLGLEGGEKQRHGHCGRDHA